MKYRIINNFWVNGIKVDLDVKMTVDSIIDENENTAICNEWLVGQVRHGINEVVDKYRMSSLPDLFLNDQLLVVTNELPKGLYGFFHIMSDTILLDCDVISGFYPTLSNCFLFGHEMGHKIMKYRDMTQSIRLLASFLDGMSVQGNEKYLEEKLADEFGNLVYSQIKEHMDFHKFQIEQEKRLCLQKSILNDIYR